MTSAPIQTHFIPISTSQNKVTIHKRPMAQQQQTRASPISTGVTTLKEWVLFVVDYHLEKRGVDEAYKKLDKLGEACDFMDDWPEAKRVATDKIREYDKKRQLQKEQREQQQQRDFMMAMMGAIQQQSYTASQKTPAATEEQEERELPPQLCTEKAMVLWQQAQQAGLVDDRYQPMNLSRTEAALLANDIAIRLGINNKWKTFERLWGRNNMRSDYNDAMNQRKTQEFLDRLKSIFGSLPRK